MEISQEQMNNFMMKLETFEHFASAGFQELRNDLEILTHAEISEIPEISTLRNVKRFPTNGRKAKIFSANCPPAA